MPAFDDSPLTQEELDFEAGCIQRALESKDKAEAEWRRKGFVYAYTDPKPCWVSVAEWDYLVSDTPIEPKEPFDRVFRLDLVGGGQIKIVEKFRPRRWRDETGKIHDHGIGRDDPELHVTAHTDTGIKRARGKFTDANLDGVAEMNCYAVVFPRGADQDVVDRVAATLRAIGFSPDNFYALLVGGQACACCNRPLRDEISRLIGVGPDCARQFRIPHSHEAAKRRLELRRKLLGDNQSN
jgi:hypothetical protein